MKDTGFLLVDKPKGITSHDVIDQLRKITGIRKIGHSGTLDPLAEGLLIVGIGRPATKRLSFFLNLDKEYIAKIRLGAISDTYDAEGKITEIENVSPPSLQKVKKVISKFIGEIDQIPPLFSAKKIRGKKLYELAREGKKIKVEPKKVKIFNIEILDYKFPYLTIKVNCSSGTYIRSLAHDIGQKLGCGGYVEELSREKIGKFSRKKAKKLSEITKENWRNFLFDIKEYDEKSSLNKR